MIAGGTCASHTCSAQLCACSQSARDLFHAHGWRAPPCGHSLISVTRSDTGEYPGDLNIDERIVTDLITASAELKTANAAESRPQWHGAEPLC